MPTKPDFYYCQSAAIPFRYLDAGALEVLLITTTKRKRWIVPKGIVEHDLTPAQSAASEAYEEAGVKGRIYDEALGRFEYAKWGGTCRVDVFPLEVAKVFDQWPEAGVRNRRWLSIDQAAELIQLPDMPEIIRQLPDWLASH